MKQPQFTRSELSSEASTVFELFEQQVRISSDAVAVLDAAGETTYAQLADRAGRIGQFFTAQGLQAEDTVGVLMSRSTDLLAVLLGIWQAGGAYVPIDPREPHKRVKRLLSSAESKWVLGDPAALQDLSLGLLQAVPHFAGLSCVTLQPAARASQPVGKPATDSGGGVTAGPAPAMSFRAEPGLASGPVGASAGDTQPRGGRLAYVLFTSGTTGEPKAVEVEHGNVMALLHSARQLLQFTPQDRYLATSTIAFDASITELFLPLVTGASVLIRDRDLLLDPKRLARDIEDFGITVFQTGPSVWSVLLQEVPDFPSLRVAITHGEAVGWEVASRLSRIGEQAWNLYGPTETTVWASGFRLLPQQADTRDGPSVPIGQPLEHVQAVVLDEDLKPVADGVEGELFIGGPSLARGYRKQPELTHKRFVAVAGQRLYRTGDLVVREPSGVLQYRGRNDDQMQIRGVRIEPAEVEEALLADPRISQAAVTWMPAAGGGRSVVAAVVARPGMPCQPDDLHPGLARRLPGTLLPSRYLFVEQLPRTTSGKVDRKAIRQMAVDTPAGSGRQAAPPADRPFLTNSEQALIRIWQRILRTEHVQLDDHFFSIGGDSLSAVQMMLEAEDAFEVQLPVHLAFEAPVLTELARRIDSIQNRTREDAHNEYIFHLAGSGTATPIFFSSVDLVLARRGLWRVDCPLYAITNSAKGSGLVQSDSLEALAAKHLATMRNIQPAGPYRLGGFSLGGLIALEIAQQVRAAGEEVELLFLLDPMSPLNLYESTEIGMFTRLTLLNRIRLRLKEIAAGPAKRGWGKWLLLFLPIMLPIERYRIFNWIHFQLVHQHLKHFNKASSLLFPRNRWKAFMFAAKRLVRNYQAKPFDGPALIVFANNGDRNQTWSELLRPDTPIHHLDVPHAALFHDPAMQTWMGWLAEALDGRSERK